MKTQLDVHLFMKVDNLREFESALKLLTEQEVLVGIPDEKADRRDTTEPINNAQLGYIHDGGSPAHNIPARPFMVPGIEDAQNLIDNKLLSAGKHVMNGDAQAAERDLHAVGLIAQNAIRNRIQTGPFVPLKPATLAARRRRGHTGEKPLIETAQMRNAVSYVLRKRKP